MFKKAMALALASVLVGALALPASAAANVWKDHSQAIQENRQIQLTGQTQWTGSMGNIGCQVTTTLTMTAGSSTGTVTQYVVDTDEAGSTVTSKCTASGGLAFCQLHSLEATELPWVAHNETQRVQITSGDISYTLTGAFCPAQKATMTPSNPANSHFITWIPNNPHTITSFTESGQVAVDTYQGSGELVTSGTAGTNGSLQILAPNGGTYSLT
jgi:hypothetical protein